MLVLQKVVKDAKAHVRLVKEVKAACARGRAKGIVLPQAIHVEFVRSDEGTGGRVDKEFYITVPYSAVGSSLVKWFVGHELTHVWQAQHHDGSLRHDKEFYRVMKILCAPSALHYEFDYLPKFAKAAGIKRLRRKP